MTRESQGARRKPSSTQSRGASPGASARAGGAGKSDVAKSNRRQPQPASRPAAKSEAKGPRVAPSLTGKQRTYLRGLAHELKPVVQIGVAGLTDGVALQIDGALEIHELIKVKVAKEAPIDAAEVGAPLTAIGAAVAQCIGRTVVLYRPRRKDPTIRLPR